MQALRLTTPQPARAVDPTIRAEGLVHLIFERPDLDRTERFLTDFGLQVAERKDDTLYLRALYGGAYCYRVHRAGKARFVGLGLAAATHDDLSRIAALPGATPIEPSARPGGGEFIQLRDPSGFLVEVLCGQRPCEQLPHRAPMTFNFGGAQRRINAWQRPPLQPPEVLRLGHVVLEVADFQATCGWYTEHFGFIPSDVQVLPNGEPIVTFMRLDLGDRPADHHTLAIAQGFMPAYSHGAFELIDVDSLAMGQRLLQDRRWKHAWGIGRHILGSQIFDYWQDPWGAKHEHYCDGDLVTAEVATGVHAVSRDAMAQWGPSMPASFTKPPLNGSALAALLRNLRRSPDLTLRKLVSLAKLFA